MKKCHLIKYRRLSPVRITIEGTEIGRQKVGTFTIRFIFPPSWFYFHPLWRKISVDWLSIISILVGSEKVIGLECNLIDVFSSHHSQHTPLTQRITVLLWTGDVRYCKENRNCLPPSLKIWNLSPFHKWILAPWPCRENLYKNIQRYLIVRLITENCCNISLH